MAMAHTIVPTKHKAYWKINNLCNFQCKYCFYEDHSEHPLTNKHTQEEIVSAFDRTGETWTIEIDGGEPFLYPKFVDLIEKLTI
jgi:sulfatase maturation enzyme AslB (radical SAM superfamily)